MSLITSPLFTPLSGSIGGSLIGLSAAVLLLGNGDILGCSGIVSSIFVKPKETFGCSKGKWKVFFTASFLIASREIAKFGESKESLAAEQIIMADSKALPIVSTLGFCIAGFFVGFGTRLGNGCTSGHGICGLARMSKRSLAAVITFMSSGCLAATMCSPVCKFAKYIRTGPENIEQFYPNEQSRFYSAILIALFGGMSVPLLMRVMKKSTTEETGADGSSSTNDDRKGPIAVVSAFLFAAGLNLSGMTKNYKIYGFLDMKGFKNRSWDPTLICVMGGGLLVSAASYHFVKGHNLFKNDKALTCPLTQDESKGGKFNVPTNTKITRQLVIGSGFFGIGWGIAGLCPGPALFLAANGYPQVLFYWWPHYIIGAFLGEKAKRIL